MGYEGSKFRRLRRALLTGGPGHTGAPGASPVTRGSDKLSISERSFWAEWAVRCDSSRGKGWGPCCQFQRRESVLGQGGSGHRKKWKVQEGPGYRLPGGRRGFAETERAGRRGGPGRGLRCWGDELEGLRPGGTRSWGGLGPRGGTRTGRTGGVNPCAHEKWTVRRVHPAQGWRLDLGVVSSRCLKPGDQQRPRGF